MNKLKVLVFFHLFLLVVVTSFDSLNTIQEDQIINSTEENVNFEVFFCQRDDCFFYVKNFLLNAKESVYCAFYELEDERLIYLIKSLSVEKKFVIDSNYYDSTLDDLDIVWDARSPYMHNKFCVVDEKMLLTGSMNPTIRGFNKNDNNLVIINSELLSKNYLEEFFELRSRKFGGGNKTVLTKFNLSGNLVENYFCPEDSCSEKLVEKIREANESIYFATFSFTDLKIANELVLAMNRGISVYGVFEKRMGSKSLVYNLLKFQGANISFDQNSYTMHHKFFVFDSKTLWTGSYNPSKNADLKNDENILIIRNGNVAEQFLEEFSYLYGDIVTQ